MRWRRWPKANFNHGEHEEGKNRKGEKGYEQEAGTECINQEDGNY